MDYETYKKSLCIFDDCHTYTGRIGKSLEQLQRDLMNLGRSYKTNIVITSHLLNNYKQTRDVLNELTKLVIFPSGTSYHSLKYCLSKYFGLDKKEIEKLLKLDSRWVCISKFPRYIIAQKDIYIIEHRI